MGDWQSVERDKHKMKEINKSTQKHASTHTHTHSPPPLHPCALISCQSCHPLDLTHQTQTVNKCPNICRLSQRAGLERVCLKWITEQQLTGSNFTSRCACACSASVCHSVERGPRGCGSSYYTLAAAGGRNTRG